MLADRCVLPGLQGQYSWTVILLSSRSEGQVVGSDSPPVSLLLRTQYGANKSKGTERLFTLHLIREEMIIDQVCIYVVLSRILNQHSISGRLFVIVRPRSLITSRLNQAAWVTLMLITSSPVLADRVNRLERWEEDERPVQMKCLYDMEKNRCCLCCPCVLQRGDCVESA